MVDASVMLPFLSEVSKLNNTKSSFMFAQPEGLKINTQPCLFTEIIIYLYTHVAIFFHDPNLAPFDEVIS